tara:strand:+ start:22201 stop:23010 length:810 start_codon:yes stop_codon:yes gene_type:complete
VSNEDNIVMNQGDDPEMEAASKQARKTFRYFWREMSWEYRRIVPGLDLAAVKVAFTDLDVAPGDPDTEHMWVNEIQCDGKEIIGALLNEPAWLTNISAGDPVCEPVSEISDWMFAIQGKVYGAYTVNLLRSRMSPRERKEHDQAWGLDFGDPEEIEVVYVEPQQKRGLFGKKSFIDPEDQRRAKIEHPMSINMGESLKASLKESKEMLHATDEDGWTMLHRDALAGNATIVKILLKHGADKNLKTPDGDTALDLARIFGWKHVMKLLSK